MTEEKNTNSNTNTNQLGRLFKSLILIILVLVIAATLVILTKRYLPYVNQIFSSSTKGASTELSADNTLDLQNKLSKQQLEIQELQNKLQNQTNTNINKMIDIKSFVLGLIKTADLVLNTTGNIKFAMGFLSLAKDYTKYIDNDAAFSAVNYAIDKDITTLQDIPDIDIESLIAKLDTISMQISTLPSLPLTPPKAISQNENTESSNKISLHLKDIINKLTASILKSLKDVVIIKHQATEPIVASEQTALRLNIQFKLFQAEVAIMQKQNKIYQSCLAKASELINKHFSINNLEAINILKELKELQKINLLPSIPISLESITAIQKTKLIDPQAKSL